MLADWDGQLTEDTRDLVSWHVEECPTCARHGWGALRPAAFSRLLPPVPLPPELREQVLSLCTSAAEDAVAYRRRVARRAESIWLARFSRAIRLLSWDSIRANPGMAIAATAVAVWVVAAVSVTLLVFAGSHAAQRPDGPVNWLPRVICPHSPDKRRSPLEESCRRLDDGGRPHIRRSEAVPGRHSARGVRTVPGPVIAVARGVEVALALAFGFALALALALEIALALALAFGVTLAFGFAYALVLPVANGLRPAGRRLVLRGGLVPR